MRYPHAVLWCGFSPPLVRHTGYSNMVNTCLRDCSEPNCPALWDLYVCHRDFTRQLLWALWRHVMSCLSRSSPDRASSSANPPGGGASPMGGRNFCFAFLRAHSVRSGGWFGISTSDRKLHIFLLSRSFPGWDSSSVNPPVGGASQTGGRTDFCHSWSNG